MTNWQDPAQVVTDYIHLVKVAHVLGGLYIWEFILNLDYEYEIITGKRKANWSFLLYLGCRWCPLIVITLQFLGFDSPHEINCQASVIMTFIFAYLSLLFASGLIVLRIYAFWEFNKIVVAVASAAWVANTASYIYSAATSRGYWTGSFCAIGHTEHTRISVFSTFITDLILLSLMLIGIMRWGRGTARRTGGILSLLYTQGITWVVVFTLAEVPPVVFITLNLNDPMNLMFLDLGLIIMSFGASRMHRGLSKYPDGVSGKEAGGKGKRGETSWFAGPSRPSYLGEDNHGAGCASPNSKVGESPQSPTQYWSGTQPCGSDMA